MSDPWTLSLLDESSSTPAWSRLDPPRFSSILAGACHFSRKEKKKKKKKKKKPLRQGLWLWDHGRARPCKPPTSHPPFFHYWPVLCMCSSRIVYSYWMLCYVVMYFWVFLAWVGPNNLICLNLSFLFITQLLRNTSLFLSALLISFILCLLEEYLSYISYTTLVLVTLSTLSISELLGWVPPPPPFPYSTSVPFYDWKRTRFPSGRMQNLRRSSKFPARCCCRYNSDYQQQLQRSSAQLNTAQHSRA